MRITPSKYHPWKHTKYGAKKYPIKVCQRCGLQYVGWRNCEITGAKYVVGHVCAVVETEFEQVKREGRF